MDIILQGPLDDFAIDTALYYLKCSLVNKVIISCWDSDPDIKLDESRIEVLRNKNIENPGIGNRNRQIVSSRSGIKASNSLLCAKLRTDQRISISSLHLMYDFYLVKGASKIFVTSLFSRYPFHPRDHVFWGAKELLVNLFDIPHCPLLPYPTMDDAQYMKHTRAETYICSYYYARFNNDIYRFIQEPEKYLIDGAPNINQALDTYYKMDEQVFKTFPPIQMSWPKRGFKFYPYYGPNPHGEKWDESEWRT